MERRNFLRAVVGVCALGSVLMVSAEPNAVPGQPPKAERPEPAFLFDSKKAESTRKEGSPSKPSSSSRRSSSAAAAKRSAEIRALTYSDSSLRLNRPLIIKTEKAEAKVRDQLRVDLLVMCRILEKAAREHLSDVHKAAGIDLLTLGGGNKSVRTMYLDDYGAVFTLNVRLPLRNETQVEEPETRESANEEWEETHNELFGQKRRAKRVHAGHRAPYDEADVQELKRELLEALKNAANIRNLKGTDHVTVAVSGPTVFESEIVQMETGRGEAKVMISPLEGIESGEVTAEESMMILTVKKSKLDEAVEKNLEMEEFEKMVNVVVY